MPSERIRSSTAHFALEEWERAVGTAAVTGYEDEVGDFGGGDGLSEVRAVSGLALRSGAMGRSGGEGGVGALGGVGHGRKNIPLRGIRRRGRASTGEAVHETCTVTAVTKLL